MNPLRSLPLPEEVHLYRFDLDRKAEEIAALTALLSPDEQERANRYHFVKDRDRFIVGRGCLRQVLAEYLQIDPAAVRLGYEPNGKPYLLGQNSLCFNLSHSHDIGLLALTRGRAVGVDIERIRDDMPLEAMAQAVFSPREQERLRALPTDAERREYFFALWALKEAFVKGIGEGLTYPLQTFTITFSADISAKSKFENGYANSWCLQRLMVAEGYCAALAVIGEHVQLLYCV